MISYYNCISLVQKKTYRFLSEHKDSTFLFYTKHVFQYLFAGAWATGDTALQQGSCFSEFYPYIMYDNTVLYNIKSCTLEVFLLFTFFIQHGIFIEEQLHLCDRKSLKCTL